MFRSITDNIDKFVEAVKDEGVLEALNKTVKALESRINKNYIKLKGELGQGYIKNPYRPVKVLTDSIEYSISPYLVSHISYVKNNSEYNPPIS